jgi:iron complex transport system substrate-binding protein
MTSFRTKQMRILFHFLVLACLFALSCCQSGNQRNLISDSAILQHVEPRYARGFDWKLCADSSVLITLFDLNSPGDTLQTIRWNRQSIEGLACLSTTHIPYLSALNSLDVLKGTCFADRMMDPAAKQLHAQGQILNLSMGNELDEEILFSIKPDLLFVYPFGGKSYDRYLSQGIGCVQISEYLEKHPLGRAEWIRLFGCLLNKQHQADSVFQEIESSYLTLRDSISLLNQHRPLVFAGSMDGDRWAVPAGNSYLATLIYDAGGSYLFSDSARSGNLVLPFETFYAWASRAEFWGKIVYEDYFHSSNQITEGDDRLLQLPAFTGKGVFACNAMQTDYHGKALLEPHVLLSDLNAIFNRRTPSTGFFYFEPWQYYAK